VKCFIVLPCYNEEKSIELLIPAIDETLSKRVSYQVIAVNDGSNDHTGETLQKLSGRYPIKVFGHATNRGLAAAIRTGLTEAIRETSDDDLIVTMDADNTHDPKGILRLAREAKKADIVISSRYVKGGRQLNVPVYRVVLSIGLNLLIRILAGIPVKDATSGYRCYRASALKKTLKVFGNRLIESRGFEALFEILVKAYWCNKRLVEVPNTLDYGKKVGKSKMKIMSTMLSYVGLLVKICLWRALGVPVFENRDFV